MQRFLFSVLFGLGMVTQGLSQAVQIVPPVFDADDYVTVIFDASKGNQALMDYRRAVYAHTGVLTSNSEGPDDWEYIQGEWGKADPKVRMSYLGDNRYQIRFRVGDFYELPPNEKIRRLAFVFRDRSGAIVAKAGEDEDFFFPPIEVEPEKEAPLNLGEGIPMGSATRVQNLPQGGLKLSDGQQSLVIRLYGKGILQLSYQPLAGILPPPSLSVVASPTELYYESPDETHLKVFIDQSHHLLVETDPVRWKLFRNDSLILDDREGFVYNDSAKTIGLRTGIHPNEHLYGGGSRAVPLDRRGYRLALDHMPSYGYQDGKTDVYLSLPYVQSSSGYAVMMDSYHKGYLDLGAKNSGEAELAVKGQALSCFLLTGTPEQISTRLADLTGHQDLPPRWALGFLQSRFGYRSERETLETTLLTRERGFGLDGICLDAYWFGGPSEMGTLEWDQLQWRTPAQMMGSLKELGVGTLPIIEPYVIQGVSNFSLLASRNMLATNSDGDPYVLPDFWAGSAALIDITHPTAQDWVWQKVATLIDQGAAGVWSDLVEPELHPGEMRHKTGLADDIHNAYPLVWSRTLYNRFRSQYPDRRWFNLIRSGHMGMQRYGTFTWSGDVSRSWGGLRAQPQIMLGVGLSGVGYMHSDLGGFTGAFDEELYQRWIQLGVFSPIMRVHGNTEDFEPEPVFQSAAVQTQVRDAINQRYQLFPYLNTVAWENHLYGWPLARPMFFHFPNDSVALSLDEQYMFGSDLLVAPILTPGQSGLAVYLPGGEWYDFHTNEHYAGKYWYRMPVEPDHPEVFVRAGKVIPTGRVAENLSQWSNDSLTWSVWLGKTPDGTIEGQLYLDDGQQFGVRNSQEFRKWSCLGGWDERHIWIAWTPAGKGYDGESMITAHKIVLHGVEKRPQTVKVGRKKLSESDWNWMGHTLTIYSRQPQEEWELKIRLEN